MKLIANKRQRWEDHAKFCIKKKANRRKKWENNIIHKELKGVQIRMEEYRLQQNTQLYSCK